MPPPAQQPERDRDLRAITSDGAYFSIMVGLGETYVPAFALAAGFGDVVAGLIATLPMLAGALFQLLTPWAVRRLRSYRRWVVGCACVQAASFFPLIVGAAIGRIDLSWLVAAAVFYWAFGMATGPAWNAWVTSLVPGETRSEFFAHRTRVAQATLLGGILVGGIALDRGRAGEAELALFAFLFAGAMVARFVSAGFLASQSEAPHVAAAHRNLGPREILHSVLEARSGRVLSYLLGLQAAVNIAAPYFTPYMLGPLDLSYVEFMTLTAASFLSRVMVLPALGRVARQRGTRAILWWGAVCVVPLPALWLVSDSFAYLFAVQVAAGAAWAALEFATLLAFFEGIPDDERASVLTAFNLGNAVTLALGALLGSQLFVVFDGSSAAFVWIFAISSAARLAMLLVLRGAVPAQRLVELRLRSLAVRPSAGSIDRPILAGFGSEAPETPGPRPGEDTGSPPGSGEDPGPS